MEIMQYFNSSKGTLWGIKTEFWTKMEVSKPKHILMWIVPNER